MGRIVEHHKPILDLSFMTIVPLGACGKIKVQYRLGVSRRSCCSSSRREGER
jgi:hypothetical protein